MTSLHSMSTRVAYEKYATPFQIKPALLMGRGSGGLKYHYGEGALLLRNQCKATWEGKGKVLRKLTLARVCLYLLLVTAFASGGLYAYLPFLAVACVNLFILKSFSLHSFFQVFRVA